VNTAEHRDWFSRNQSALAAALEEVRWRLERHIAAAAGEKAPLHKPPLQPPKRTLESEPAPTALERLCDRFGLSAFERNVLLLVAGMELDGRFPGLCARAGGRGEEPPTFALALALFDDPSWAALAPAAPLRHWRLVEMGKGASLVQTPLRIDQHVLDYLTGQQHADPRLVALAEPLPDPDVLAPSQARLAERIALLWSEAGDALPIIQLAGPSDGPATRAVAAAACRQLGLGLSALSAAALPLGADELETVLRLAERHAMLTGSAVLLACDGAGEPEPARESAIARLVERLDAPLLLAGRKRRASALRPLLSFDVAKPTIAEQQAIWHAALGGDADTLPAARRLATQFHLEPGAIRAACADARAELALAARAADALAAAVWECCRAQARPQLDDLAQRIAVKADWPELILPEPQQHTLRVIAAQLRHRATVHHDWGFAAQSERGLGLAVLFAGSSGTGKTMAAEVLARHLDLDLYRVDLSAVVSKYIGETEKNLRKVFDAAEEGGAILLFDEADALFGKRTEVRDSHDRHANVEISYLLQRVETYRGLAILTTNMKEALDPAFLRRLRFIVSFPFPGPDLRARIWARMFPAAAPTRGLDATRLAQLAVSGGQIRNIALNAAFLAAEAGRPVGMADILAAARAEYVKLEKTLSDAEIKGWPA
jgi:hypothetical protein